MQLPHDFIIQSSSLFSSVSEREDFFSSISEKEPPVSIRLNPNKPAVKFQNMEPVPWEKDFGRYLPSRPSFTLDPFFWGGAYYPQEASSMIVGTIVRKLSPKRVLDLCAAPGGKTTHIASVIPEGTFLVSNEVISSRAKVLTENVQRWGTGNVVVTSAPVRVFSKLGGFFDMIVADVPCSGEGMFRKDSGSIDQWSLDSVKACTTRSRSIISEVWNALAPGGWLIFSTCTYNSSENEETVCWIAENLGAEIVPIPVDCIPSSDTGYHFYPHKIRGEGFFVCLLRKLEKTLVTSDFSVKRRISYSSSRPPLEDEKILRGYVQDSRMSFFSLKDSYYAFQTSLIKELDELSSVLSPLYMGVNMGRIFSGKLKPSHALAMYCHVTPQEVSELSVEDAIHYLRRDTQDVSLFSQGLSVVRCDGVNLGWANGIQGRVNNLYPTDLRILKTIT